MKLRAVWSPQTKLSLVTAFLFVGVFAVATTAAEPSGFKRSLFDGKTLNGWVVTDCEAEVQDGALLLKSGNGLVRSEHNYTDFILELDWKALQADNWDSGIYFRAKPAPKGRPWPTRYQANLLKGLEGNVNGLEGATSKGLIKPGEWNHFKLTVIGKRAALSINGTPAWEGEGLENASGLLGLQAEVPKGGQFLFKNITITELGFETLFNGKDLTGWKEAGKSDEPCWEVEDGMITCTGKRGQWLRSLAEHGDFNLRLEYKLMPGGNSGVYVRVPENGNHHGKGAGVEIQVLDDKDKNYAKLKDYQYCGSVYGIAPSQTHVGRPAGQWNTMEINTKGKDYRVTHNGTVIVDAKVGEFPLLEERITRGFLGLQNHSTRVWYRDLRIGPPQP